MTNRLVNFTSPGTHIRATYVDVSDAARELSRRHLSGPAASLVLGEALAAVALLSSDMSKSEECITLRTDVSGPVGGYLVEATAAGGLRGFTRNKVLGDLDAEVPTSTHPLLGERGSSQIVHSLPSRVLSSANLELTAPCTHVALARYFNHSMQTPTGVSLLTRGNAVATTCARGLIVERMPDGDRDAFVQVLERLTPERPFAALQNDDPPSELSRALGLTDLQERDTRSMHFACRCAREKAAAALQTLSQDERNTMIADGKGTTIYCHMCGQGFALGIDDLRAAGSGSSPES